MAESSPKGLKTLWEKEKFLIMSNFSFSNSVFQTLVQQTHENKGMCVKGFSKSMYILKGALRLRCYCIHPSCFYKHIIVIFESVKNIMKHPLHTCMDVTTLTLYLICQF